MDEKLILEWFRFADTDLTAANHLLSLYPQPLEIICYHCQQSAEKYLKGYLGYCGVDEPPKTHDLSRLCALCAEYDIKFDEIRNICAFLTEYGIQPRYPDEIEIDENDMKKALAYAEQVKAFEPLQAVRRKLEKGLEKDENTHTL
ncbi:MAG: HEPN domain-containing protein [Oscillospiraceae bacterium]|nr:HEPN domain-containing protein [Oscillospiraceae bacterium]